jgi:creatinine amidohydrolase
MLLENMTMADFKKNIKNTKTIIIPFGTVEEHGDHLPLNTDTLIVYEVLKRVVKKRKAFLAPPVYYGVCTTTGGHPGTLSISPATLRSITRDLITDAYSKGFRKIFLITGHGGGLHSSALKEAAEELVCSLKGVRLAVLCPYDLLYKELAELADTPNDSHAGEIETSIVLALAPELVRGRSKEDYPKIPKPFVVRDKMKYWKSGVWGNPEKASAEKGRKAIKLIVDSIIKVMDMA